MARDAANPNNEVLYMRVPKTLMDKVRVYADKRELTINHAIRELLEERLGKIGSNDSDSDSVPWIASPVTITEIKKVESDD